ncbi:transposable element Tc3 transposase [Trichonephila clavipes]|nr:transposable element Tc3 transposase [Trichonephila clavipes]
MLVKYVEAIRLPVMWKLGEVVPTQVSASSFNNGSNGLKKTDCLGFALYGLVESIFKNDEGHNVTVNGYRYRSMITNFFIAELNTHDVQELWFQQDGATCHTARATIDCLKDTFGDRLISRFGPVNWPSRSCDLTPLDYFL